MDLLAGFRNARRRRILERFPIEDDLWNWAMAEHRIFTWLGPPDTARLRELSTLFLVEKTFRPVGGAVLNDETKVSVAAQACLPLLGLSADWYSDWSTILLTPREYEALRRDVDQAGVVHESDDRLAGEVFDLGPVALSLEDIEASGWGDGYNVVIHEMAHKIDGRDGILDGCPPLHPDMDGAAWTLSFREAYEDLLENVERSPSGRSRIDGYAARSPDEFFAVACEYFYEKPALLRSEYPAVYGQLVRFFQRDPGGS